jgi:hypothetical protein
MGTDLSIIMTSAARRIASIIKLKKNKGETPLLDSSPLALVVEHLAN